MNTTSIDHETAVQQLSALMDRRRLPQAREVLGKALPQFPDSTRLLQYAAWIDWMEDRPEEALESIDRILQIDPSSFDARFLLARIRAEQERYGESERAIIELLREYPDEPELYAHYADVMLQTFNLDKAERLAAEALKRDPDNESALNVHTLCGFIGAPDEEQRARLHRFLEQHPDQVRPTLGLIQHLIDNGRNREAYELARELVALDPGNQAFVELAQDLRHASHWSLRPLWPMQKWGWGGAIAIWAGAVLLFRSGILEDSPLGPYAHVLAFALLGYVVYSWVWPPMLRRLLR